MSITSFTFVLFVFAVLTVYYLIPRKWQWTVLLAASCVFSIVPGLKEISSGFRIIILTLIIAGIAAYVKPIAQTQGEEGKEHE